MNELPPIMKKGCWESGPTKFGSFEFKGETITIDSEEKAYFLGLIISDGNVVILTE